MDREVGKVAGLFVAGKSPKEGGLAAPELAAPLPVAYSPQRVESADAGAIRLRGAKAPGEAQAASSVDAAHRPEPVPGAGQCPFGDRT